MIGPNEWQRGDRVVAGEREGRSTSGRGSPSVSIGSSKRTGFSIERCVRVIRGTTPMPYARRCFRRQADIARRALCANDCRTTIRGDSHGRARLRRCSRKWTNGQPRKTAMRSRLLRTTACHPCRAANCCSSGASARCAAAICSARRRFSASSTRYCRCMLRTRASAEVALARGQLDVAAALITPLLETSDDPEYRGTYAEILIARGEGEAAASESERAAAA